MNLKLASEDNKAVVLNVKLKFAIVTMSEEAIDCRREICFPYNNLSAVDSFYS